MNSVKNIDVYFSLGSNIGEREANIREALRRMVLAFGKEPEAVSSFMETPAMGFEGEDFINCAVLFETFRKPEEILDICKSIEKEMGRKEVIEFDEDGKRIYHSRIIDIDILLYGDGKIKTAKLEIPHPRMYERDFVMIPLREIYR